MEPYGSSGPLSFPYDSIAVGSDAQGGLPEFLRRRQAPYAQPATMGPMTRQAYELAGPGAPYTPGPMNISAPLAPFPSSGGGGGGGGGGSSGGGLGGIGAGLLAALAQNPQGASGLLNSVRDVFRGGGDPTQGLANLGSLQSLSSTAGVGGIGQPGLLSAGTLGGSGPMGAAQAFDLLASGGGSLSGLAGIAPGFGSSTGLGAAATGSVADAAAGQSLSSMLGPSGSIASQAGGMGGALQAGAGTAGAAGALGGGGLLSALSPSAVAAGAYPGGLTSGAIQSSLLANTPAPAPFAGSGAGALGTAAGVAGLVGGGLLAYHGISSGREGQAALGGAIAGVGAGSLAGLSGLAALGPVGLVAAGVAALGASMVNTKEFGDVALRNYWSGVDQGRNIGESDPTELAQGFINFYRTNKNEFPGQAVYGRTGNEDFMFDLTQEVNRAVTNGLVPRDATPGTIYEQAIKPWLAEMGPGPQDEKARAVQDFMMTDLINSFMQGKPISNAQIKNDSKFRIVSERPVYAGGSRPTDGPIADGTASIPTPPDYAQMQGLLGGYYA